MKCKVGQTARKSKTEQVIALLERFGILRSRDLNCPFLMLPGSKLGRR